MSEATLYREFGVNAEYLIDHAHGVEPCTIADIHAYEPSGHSLGNGQVLPCDYSFEEARDVLFDGAAFHEFAAPRIATKNTHGTGCTYSAAIAAYLAQGGAVVEAVGQAKRYLTEAIRHSFEIGHGHGPLNHFWNLA